MSLQEDKRKSMHVDSVLQMWALRQNALKYEGYLLSKYTPKNFSLYNTAEFES